MFRDFGLSIAFKSIKQLRNKIDKLKSNITKKEPNEKSTYPLSIKFLSGLTRRELEDSDLDDGKAIIRWTI